MTFKYLCVIYVLEKLTISPDFFLAHNIPHMPQSRNWKEKKKKKNNTIISSLRSQIYIFVCCYSGDHNSRLGNDHSCQHFHYKPYISGRYISALSTFIQAETRLRRQIEDEHKNIKIENKKKLHKVVIADPNPTSSTFKST